MIDGKKIIALCTYGIYEATEFTFLSELSRILPAHNCFMFIYTLNSEIGITNTDSTEAEVFDMIPYDKVDIVVIMNEKIKLRSVSQKIIDRATEFDVPVIVVDGEFENVSQVKYDYNGGFEKVVRHIIEDHQIKKPHFMAGHINNSFSNERIEVFKKVLKENNIPFDDTMLSYGEFWSLPCRAATYALLERDELPDAIICANDIMAINVCDVLTEAGIKVPEDIIVSGFDGIDEAFTSTPGITTAVCDSNELAHSVMDVLTDVLSGKRNITKWIQPVFIPNESCGCSRKDLHVKSTVSELNELFYHHEDEIHLYQSIISKIMMGKDIGSSVRYMKENHAQYAQVVVEKSCFDLNNNFFYDDLEKGAKTVIYDSYDSSDTHYPYDPDCIIPHLKEIMEIGQPIIFNSLIYMDKCCGFICYSYPRTMLLDYSRTPNLTFCFGMSIGGYVVTRYQKYLRDKMQEMYQNDGLTGLYNRLAFLSRISEQLKEADMKGKMLNVIMVDLNGLKEINDNLGHLSGDEAIKAVATALKASCPPEAICVRAGGDEMFSIIFGEYDLKAICNDIEQRLKVASDELGLSVTASIGTYSTIYDGSPGVISRAIGIADENMYGMKRKIKQELKKDN